PEGLRAVRRTNAPGDSVVRGDSDVPQSYRAMACTVMSTAPSPTCLLLGFLLPWECFGLLARLAINLFSRYRLLLFRFPCLGLLREDGLIAYLHAVFGKDLKGFDLRIGGDGYRHGFFSDGQLGMHVISVAQGGKCLLHLFGGVEPLDGISADGFGQVKTILRAKRAQGVVSVGVGDVEVEPEPRRYFVGLRIRIGIPAAQVDVLFKGKPRK